ncbi:MAG: PfkB family carbohydrate kinase [Parvibaculaceae bacterium]
MTQSHISDAIASIRHEAGTDKRIAFLSGNFNVVHPGHLRILKFAAENGDILVVGVNPDTTPGVTIPADLRIEGLNAISLVTHALLLDTPPEDFIRALEPDVVVKGKEYEERYNAEQDVVSAYGGQLLFSSGEMRFASINLLQREYFETNFSTIQQPKDYAMRHGFASRDLLDVLPKFAGLRVLVIGDLIVDTYVNCEPLGMSQEDPTIVVTPIEEKTFIGGAGIVAAHARSLGADVRFLSVAGDDAPAEFARSTLDELGVESTLLSDRTRPTTHKRRYRAQGKTLLRVNQLRQHAIGSEIQLLIMDRLLEHLPHTDLLLFSDFNYGVLPQAIVDATCEAARMHGIMMAADSQASSQVSDISRFKGMHLITPTEREARMAIHDHESGLAVIGERLQKAAEAQNVVVTLGSEGLLIHAAQAGMFMTDRLPAYNSAPKDVAGAGDSFFTCASMALCAGYDIWRSSYLGALAAACQVSRVGNTPLSYKDLAVELSNH